MLMVGNDRKKHIINEKPKYKPLLYYVKTGGFFDIDARHEEVSSLLKIRNIIVRNKSLSQRECAEDCLCSVLNKIKSLSNSHHLKKQHGAIDSEATCVKSFFNAKKTIQSNGKVLLKVSEQLALNE